MSEADRAAMRRGTLTSGIDLEQVAAARAALAAMREDMAQPCVEPVPVTYRTCVLAGALAGAVVWLILG
jgi:hypothetical protein